MGSVTAQPGGTHAGLGEGSLMPLLCTQFILTGVVNSLLGPAMPWLRMHFAITASQAGILFAMQFAGSSVGAVFSQGNHRRSILTGFVLIALSVAAVPLLPWTLACLAVFFLGLGLGFSIPATNMLVAQRYEDTRAASLNVLNMMWGVGATLCPFLLIVLQLRMSMRGTLLAIAGAVLLMFFVLAAHLPSARVPVPALPSPKRADPSASIVAVPLLLLMFMMFLYLGTEAVVSGWTASYVHEITLDTSVLQSVAVSSFWLAALVGRALAPLSLRIFGERNLALVSLSAALAGTILLIASHSGIAAAASAVVAGLGFAPIYSLNVSQLSALAESKGARVPGWFFSFAGLGGAVLPWMAGRAATNFGSIRYGLWVSVAATSLLLLLWPIAERLSRPPFTVAPGVPAPDPILEKS